jgi:hypothetical protein
MDFVSYSSSSSCSLVCCVLILYVIFNFLMPSQPHHRGGMYDSSSDSSLSDLSK